MSTTPRTDEQVFDWTTEDGSDVVFASFARQLETELAHLNDEVDRLKKDNLDMGHWIGSKMYEPEWNSFKKSLEVINHWKTRAEEAEKQFKILNETMQHVTVMYDNAMVRAEKAEAEAKQLINKYVNIQHL